MVYRGPFYMECCLCFIVVMAMTMPVKVSRGEEIDNPLIVRQRDNVTFRWSRSPRPLDKVLSPQETLLAYVTLSGNVEVPGEMRRRVQARRGSDGDSMEVSLLDVRLSEAGLYSRLPGLYTTQAWQRQLLLVQDKPDKPRISLTSGHLQVGREETLLCETKSNSLPGNHSLPMTFTWTAIPALGVPVRDTYVIYVRPEDRNMTFTFSCRAQEMKLASEESDVLSLIPKYAPMEMTVTSTPKADVFSRVKVGQGQLLTLTCAVECMPACRVSWTHEEYGELNTGMNKVTHKDIAGPLHSGIYRCLAYNQFGNATRHITVDLLYNAGIKNVSINGNACQNGDTVEVSEGTDVTFGFVVNSNPKPSVSLFSRPLGIETWSSPTEMGLQGPAFRLYHDRKLHLYSGNWSVPSVACSDHREYLLAATSPDQQQRDTFHVKMTVRCTPRLSSEAPHSFRLSSLPFSHTVHLDITAFPRGLVMAVYLDNVLARLQPVMKATPLPEPWKVAVTFDLVVQDARDVGTYRVYFTSAAGHLNVTFQVSVGGDDPELDAGVVVLLSLSALAVFASLAYLIYNAVRWESRG